VSAAVRLSISADDTIGKLAIGVGGASEVARRMRALEASLEGRRRAEAARLIEGAPLLELAPIDDCRAPAAHRIHSARVAIARAFNDCFEETGHDVSSA